MSEGRDVIFADVETGGLDCQTDALLEIGAWRWHDGVILEGTRLSVRSEGLRVTEEALAVNKIDTVEHDADPETRWRVEAASDFLRWVRNVTGRDRKIEIGGQNVGFDIGFLKKLVGDVAFGETFSYHYVDTKQIAKFLRDAGLMPGLKGNKLSEIADYLGIDVGERRDHSSLSDALTAAKVYTKMLAIVRGEMIV